MKKATWIIFIFAILMIALLVSCNTTPDPLPDESTTGDVTPEVTPEPTDVTSDEAEVSEPVETTTEEVTTEALSIETTVEMPEWVSETGYSMLVYYMYLDPVPNQTVTTDPSEEPIQIPETATPWYITEWEPGLLKSTENGKEWLPIPAVPDVKISEDEQNLAVRLPSCSEYICEDMKVKVETFQEYYRLGAPIQVRFSIEMMTGEPFFLKVYPEHWLSIVDLNMTGYDRHIVKHSLKYCSPLGPSFLYNSLMQMNETATVRIYPEKVPEGYEVGEFVRENGFGIFELMIFAQPTVLEQGGTYVLQLLLTENYKEFYIVQIPLEIVEVEYIDP